ncbi:MAG: aldehyde ferredoxin oxidoreductase family protein [Eubacteriales bacterium]|nr:aldehyde ferredoxin oxidoreductase family protein [Eubacteriales bacterium]MDD3200265.1 aldehyde ferredoxin oxidoreductase family protein [Eubacteriales bacterium]MDD4629343.1 aldehyde ferredoxin oxidoreductase family protein [Eubacteriales bacterium]
MKTKLYGYAGKELWVDLTAGCITIKEIDPAVMRKYIGGTGFCAALLFTELEAGINPLSAENIVVFATSPLSLNKVPGGGSVIVGFKSPITGAWGEARSGGNFGPDMKRAGFDFIIIKGKSDKPVYLEVVDGTAVLKDAANLKGKDVYEKDSLMKNQLVGGNRKHMSAMCIGLGGENLVRFSSIMHEDRAAGRGGAGAVMGYKNLMGIIVSGSAEIEAANPDQLQKILKRTMEIVIKSDARQGMHAYGTVGDLPANDEDGDLPTKNWRSNSFGKGAEIFDSFQNNNLIKAHPCYAGCPIGCGRIIEVKEGKYKTPVHEGGEYETIAAFTAFLFNDNADLAVKCDYLCNKYGIDTLTTAAVISFAMECYENKIITEADTGGYAFEWGDADAILQGIDMVVNRNHIGDLLAEGVKIASERLGEETKKFAIHVKGLEGPAHDPRSGKLLGITYGTANRGMCHIHPLEGMAFDRGKMDWGMMKYGVRDPETVDRWDEKGKGIDCKILQDGLSSADVLSTCKFMMYAGVTIDHWSEILSALTGWDIDGEELYTICERVINLQRLFNMREGLSRKDDMLPERVLSAPEFGIYENNQDCVIKDFNALLDEYYKTRGWDIETGCPTADKQKELGLTNILL